ncbi:MAG: carbohydrate binding domain-containing protein, partial [Armatimonadota bacterium]
MRRVAIFALTIVLLPALAVAQEGEEVRLLSNPGFEDGLEGWGFWPEESNATMNVETDVALEGDASLRVDASGPADRAFVLQSSTEYEPGVIYRVSVAIRKDASIADG